MALRMRQPLETICAGKIYSERLEVDEKSGIAKMVRVDDCAVLPSSDKTDLKMMLKAGVPLEQVNCKVLDPVGTVHLSGDSEKVDDKKTASSEVNNAE